MRNKNGARITKRILMGAALMTGAAWAEEAATNAAEAASVATAQGAAATTAMSAVAGAEVVHKKDAATSILHIKYSNYMNGPTFAESAGGSINHIATMKVDLKRKFWVSGNFRFDTTIEKTTSIAKLADPYVVLGSPKLKVAQMDVSGQLWTSAGVAEESRAMGLVSVLQTRIYLERTIGKWSLSNTVIPKFYVYQDKKVGQKFMFLESFVNASYELNKIVTIDMGVDPTLSFMRGQATVFNDLAVYPGFTLTLGKKVALSPYLEIFAANPQMKTTSAGAFLSATIF